MSEKTIRAILYARFSCDNQKEESIEGQRRDCEKYAENYGIVLVGEYVDRALSARTDNRAQFQQMIRDSRNREFDAVLVWKLDRFARNRADSIKYKTILKKNGVKVISATEAIGDGAESVILESVLEGMAEYYSLDLAEKMKRGMTDNALRCDSCGGVIPFGFKTVNKKIVPDEETAPIVKKLFHMYAYEGKSLRDLKFYLNSLPTGKKLIGSSAMARMMANVKYIGYFKYDQTLIKGGIPAIVDEETFRRCQERLKTNKRMLRHFIQDTRYILTVKAFCGKCGDRLFGESGKGERRPDGTMSLYRYYKCANNKQKKGCDMPAIRKDFFEDFVVSKAIEFIKEDGRMAELAKNIYEYQFKENPFSLKMKDELTSLDKKISNVMQVIEDGLATQATKTRLMELENQRENLQKEIAEDEEKHPAIELDEIKVILREFSRLPLSTVEQKQAVVNSMIDKVILHNEGPEKSVEIYFNVGDGKSSIRRHFSLSELREKMSPLGLLPNLYLVGDCFGMTIHAGTSIFVGSKAR